MGFENGGNHGSNFHGYYKLIVGGKDSKDHPLPARFLQTVCKNRIHWEPPKLILILLTLWPASDLPCYLSVRCHCVHTGMFARS